LRNIDRLPPNHRYLSVAILKSIVLMYDEIRKHRGKSARAQCVRSCFANEAHLRAGVLSLLELLDPSSSGLLADSSSDELIEALLLQERAIWQRARARRVSGQSSVQGGAVTRRGARDAGDAGDAVDSPDVELSNEELEATRVEGGSNSSQSASGSEQQPPKPLQH
jgi:hypothetical protein